LTNQNKPTKVKQPMKHMTLKLAGIQLKYAGKMTWLYIKREWYMAQLIFVTILGNITNFILRK
jgi:hypothetical protein